MSNDYPEYVDLEDRPEATIGNVPDDVIEGAIEIAVTYRRCPECGQEQFINMVPGHNSTHECRECEATMAVVG